MFSSDCVIFKNVRSAVQCVCLCFLSVTGFELWGTVLATGLVCTLYTTIVSYYKSYGSLSLNLEQVPPKHYRITLCVVKTEIQYVSSQTECLVNESMILED